MTSRGPARRALVWTARALRDLEAIDAFIAKDDADAAHRWIERLLALGPRVQRLPYSGRRVPEVGRQDVRETRLRTYRVIYRVTATRVEIVTVFEGRRRFPSDVAASDE